MRPEARINFLNRCMGHRDFGDPGKPAGGRSFSLGAGKKDRLGKPLSGIIAKRSFSDRELLPELAESRGGLVCRPVVGEVLGPVGRFLQGMQHSLGYGV